MVWKYHRVLIVTMVVILKNGNKKRKTEEVKGYTKNRIRKENKGTKDFLKTSLKSRNLIENIHVQAVAIVFLKKILLPLLCPFPLNCFYCFSVILILVLLLVPRNYNSKYLPEFQ